ncbi:ABC transporter permease [Paenibacillus humicola]|uniref:ABC transporter permease n=1 Tax=Paenibacillus humicola TaxID=3110540 RepID=UPI00237BA7BA|nr:ABC transporter permease [Paenibacillus humicola]
MENTNATGVEEMPVVWERRKWLPFLRGFKKAGGLAVTVAVILGVWQLASMMSNNATLLPGPAVVGKTLADLFHKGLLIEHTAASLGRILTAWILSAIIAVPLGVLMGRVAWLEKLIRPFIEIIRPISPLAWIPLAILWFGIGLSGKLFVIMIASIFPILLNTISGVQEVNPTLLRAAKSFGCSPLQMTFKVCIPAALPTIATGLRISFGSAWMAIIAAEMVASKSGLGYMIIDGMEILRSDIVIAGMVVIGVLGYLFDIMFRMVERKMM